MANIDALIGYNGYYWPGSAGNQQPKTAVNKLFAVYGNDIVDVDAGTGYGLNLDISTYGLTMVNFLGRVFAQSYANKPLMYNPESNKWTNWGSGSLFNSSIRVPRAKYIYPWKNKLYLVNCILGHGVHNNKFLETFEEPVDTTGAALAFPSHVFYSDVTNTPNKISWGLEFGGNGVARIGTNLFKIGQTGKYNYQDFGATNIKIGDPLFIENIGGTQVSLRDKNPYHVTGIDSAYQLRLSPSFPIISDIDPNKEVLGIDFWVGSNWFPVGVDDGDFLTGVGENGNFLLFFKQFSLWAYSGSSLQKIPGSLGTTSFKSILNIGNSTFFFHGSDTTTRKTGIYMFNGSTTVLVSRAIQKFVDGISTSNYSSVVAWREGSKLRMYVGDLTNAAEDISISNAVLTLDTDGNQWSIDPIAHVITAATTFIESNTEKIFLGTSTGKVIQTPSGNSFANTPIAWQVERGVVYPSGSEITNLITRVKIESKNAQGVSVAYKLIGTPDNDDVTWTTLGTIRHNHEEFRLSAQHNYARGIDFKFSEIGIRDRTQLIKKISVFYIPQSTK